MIVYHELSSLHADLGISEKALYTVSNSIHKHYRKHILSEKNGKKRVLYIPSETLKHIQRKITDVLLAQMEVSPYATAYRPCCGPSVNASVHVGQPYLLKLDIRHFFDSISFSAVKKYAFPAEKYSENIRTLLTLLCTYNDVLPQGAPSSPAISNLVMKKFDDIIGPLCDRKGIRYSRYCDDMTFSGSFDPEEIIAFVKNELKEMHLLLNDRKTHFLRPGQKKTVTGYVINEKLNVSSDYKRKLRQEMYYSMKYGIRSHLQHTDSKVPAGTYVLSLLGRVNFVLSAEPNNPEFSEYRSWLMNAAKDYPLAVSSEKGASTASSVKNDSIIHVPCFGDIDISLCPSTLDPVEIDSPLFPDTQSLFAFAAANFLISRKAGKTYAICRGENSLAAVILIVEGVLRAKFFPAAKTLLCDSSSFWRKIKDARGSDVRNGFPPFYTNILDLFRQYRLIYTDMTVGRQAPSAIVIPNYDKLISGWLPRSCKKEVLQRGIGILAGEKNGIVLESYAKRHIKWVINYKNGIFTLKLGDRKVKLPIEGLGIAQKHTIEDIESRVEYDRIGVGKENDGLTMRNNGSTYLLFKME